MLPAIIHKIDQQMKRGITSEVQVLYIMTQIRKSLEHGMIKLNNDSALKFYCDWVLHSHLKGRYAQEVLEILNPAHDFYNFHSMDLELPKDIYNQISPIISLDNFRHALHEYIICADLPDSVVCIPQKWHGFLREYLKIIEDCPLKVRQDYAHLSIKEIIVNVSNNGSSLSPPRGEKYSFTVHWRFVGKNGIDGLVNNHLTTPM